MKKYHLMGTCHVDLAWHGDEEQYANYLEQFTVVLLDLLDQNPDVTYLIEQAYHYRKLQSRRPDLIDRLRRYIADGRIEVVGGMVSTLDTNMPCGESIVRNQQLGLRWFRREMGAEVETAWLVDAFGSSAQIPQILASFGLRQMMSSRFGGDKHHDRFLAEGLDGTRLFVIGRDAFSQNLPTPERARLVSYYVADGASVDGLFEKARRTRLDGPLLVHVYIEDETYPTRRTVTRFRELQEFAREHGDEARFTLLRDFFADLRALGEDLPVESADLNPEFTGTYAHRVEIRLHNRRAETALLEAERWLALRGEPSATVFDEAWWNLGFVHFHDVFTGSHPDCVFSDVLSRLDGARQQADAAIARLFGAPALPGAPAVRLVNSLPFPRYEWVRLPGAAGRVARGPSGPVPSYRSGEDLWFAAEVDACATAVYTLEPAKGALEPVPEGTTLENEYVRLEVDADRGVTLTDRKSGRTLLDGARDLLVVQGDTGNFQFEQLVANEQHAWSAPVLVDRLDACSVSASGLFFDRDGALEASWRLVFTVRPGEPLVGLHVHVDWRAIGKRLRLKLSTTLDDAGAGVYEVPFGAVRRRPYTPGFSHKGEWPAQRFVAVEGREAGLALVNDGVPGVETLCGTMATTLLRAPVQTYAHMVPDDSSQQHGTHDFAFALLAYRGRWEDSDVLRMARRWNTPLRLHAAASGDAADPSALSLDNPSVMLSALKGAVDAPEALVLRLYEGTGRGESCSVRLPGAVRAWESDMLERRGPEIPVESGGVLRLDFRPWQIRTLLVERNPAR